MTPTCHDCGRPATRRVTVSVVGGGAAEVFCADCAARYERERGVTVSRLEGSA